MTLLPPETLARPTRVSVAFRPRESDYHGPRYYSLGEHDDVIRPFVVGISALPSAWSITTMTAQIGEVTVDIITAQPGGGGGIIQAPEIFAPHEGAANIMEIGLGDVNTPANDFETIFAGPVASVNMSPTQYSVTATDGIDDLRALDQTRLPEVDLYPGQILSGQVARQVDLALIALVEAAGGGDQGIYGIWRTRPELGEDWQDMIGGEFLDWPGVDARVTQKLLLDLATAGDPKQAIERAMLSPLGTFLRRDAKGDLVVAEIRPLDKLGSEGPDASPFRLHPIPITDFEIIEQSATWQGSQHIRAVDVRFGPMVYDYWQDYIDSGSISSSFITYSQPRLGKYAYAHRFEVIPGATDPTSGARVPGRVAKYDSPFAAQTQGDPHEEDVIPPGAAPLGGELAFAALYYERHDYLGFPVPYQWHRRPWKSPQHTMPREHLPITQANAIGVLHDQVSRIYRAGAIPHRIVTIAEQSRTGVRRAVGDAVTLDSEHSVDPGNRTVAMRLGGQVGQVVSRSLDIEGGRVILGVAVPIDDAGHDSPEFWAYETQVVHDANQGADRAEANAEFTKIGLQPPTDLTHGAYHRLRDAQGDPRADDDPVYGHRFHWVAYQARFVLKLDGSHDIGTRFVFKWRASLLANVADEGAPHDLKVLFSQRKTLGIVHEDDPDEVTIDDAICCPGVVAGVNPDRAESIVFRGTAVYAKRHTEWDILFFDRDMIGLAKDDIVRIPWIPAESGVMTTRVFRVEGNTVWVDDVEHQDDINGLSLAVQISRIAAEIFSPDAGIDRPHLTHEKETLAGVEHPSVWGLKVDVEAVHRVDNNAPGGADFADSGQGIIHYQTFIDIRRVRFVRQRFYLPGDGNAPSIVHPPVKAESTPT